MFLAYMHLQASIGAQSSEGLTEAKGSGLLNKICKSGSFTWRASQCWLLTRMLASHHMYLKPQGCLSNFTAWQLLFPECVIQG